MVMLALSIKAELENVTDLVPVSDDFEYFFKVECTSCHQPHPNVVTMSRLDRREISGGKGGIANFVWRCAECKRESWAKIDSPNPLPYNAENGQFGRLLVVECRGLEFTGFEPRGIWQCTGTGEGSKKSVFADINLEEGEWNDYDEKTSLPVGISEFGSEWTRA